MGSATDSLRLADHSWTPSGAGPERGRELGEEPPGLAGATQPHENRMPFGALTFIIALSGVFPTQS